MRGEHFLINGRQIPVGGSSPHARGALAEVSGDAEDGGIIPACAGSTRRALEFLYGTERKDGIIPACAGSTVRRNVAVAVVGDHPRMRGEHSFVSRH